MSYWPKATWIESLDHLPGLNLTEKARARVIILSKPREDRELYFAGTYAEAAATIKALLRETPQSSLNLQPSSLLSGTPSAQPPAAAMVPTPTPTTPAAAAAAAGTSSGLPAAHTSTHTPNTTSTTAIATASPRSTTDAMTATALNMGAINAHALSRFAGGTGAPEHTPTSPFGAPQEHRKPPQTSGPSSAKTASILPTTSSALRVRWATDAATATAAAARRPESTVPAAADLRPLSPPAVPWWRSEDAGASSMEGYVPHRAIDLASPSTTSNSSSSPPQTPPRRPSTQEEPGALNLTIYSLTTGLSTAYDKMYALVHQPSVVTPKPSPPSPEPIQHYHFGPPHLQQHHHHHHYHKKQIHHQHRGHHHRVPASPPSPASAASTTTYSRPYAPYDTPFAAPSSYHLVHASSSSSFSTSPRRSPIEVLVRTAASVNYLGMLPEAFRAALLRERQPGDIFCRTFRKKLESTAVGRTVRKTTRFIMVVDVHDEKATTLVLVKLRSKEISRVASKDSLGGTGALLYKAEVVPDPEDSFEAISERLDRRAVKVGDIVMWKEIPDGWALWDGKPREVGVEYEQVR